MKMKMLCVFGMFVVQACAAKPADEVKEQAVSTNPFHWMVGIWDCPIVNYHVVPEAQTLQHQMSGVYTVVEDDTGVHGVYREKDDGQFGPLDFEDEWLITDQRWPKDKAWALATYRAHGTSAVFSIESAGVVREPLTGSNLLGFAMFGSPSTPDLRGTLTLPDGLGRTITRGWGGVMSSAAPLDGPDAGKITFGRNWRVQVNAAGTQRQYIDDQCFKRPDA